MSETKKTIKERLWNIRENPYYKMNPETGEYEMVDEETIKKVKKQEQDEYNAAQELINEKNAQILDDDNFLKESREKQRLDEEKKKNYMQNAGRKKRRTGRRKSNKRKSNKRKSHKRRGSRRR
jgi:hypothetical protein